MYGRRKYTIFIDDSGDAGVEKVRTHNTPGASEFLTLGAVLMVTKNFQSHRDLLFEIKGAMNKNDIQCKNLNHFQKVYFAKKLASVNHIICFGVISKKSTLGNYAKRIENDSTKFYNKCCLYLFEMIGRFLRDSGISMDEIDFVMEEGNFQYQALRSYLRRCRDNPQYATSKMLAFLNPDNIIQVPWKDEELLTYADLVTHSLYKAVDKPASCLHQNETRYLNELKTKFVKSKSDGKIVGYGLKVIHKVSHLDLDDETSTFLTNLAG